MHRELYFSILFFIISSIGASLLFYKIQLHNHEDNIILKNIKSGKNEFFLFENGSCFGNFEYTLNNKNDISEITANSNINLRYLSQDIPLGLRLESSFNSIGQMGAALLKISIFNNYLLIGTKNIDPIILSVKSDMPGLPREFSWQLQGPVTISKQSDGNYNISGFSLSKFRLENAENLPDKDLLNLPVQMINKSSGAQCQKQRNFDISNLATDIKKIYSSYLKL